MAGGLPKTFFGGIIVSMSESNYCKDCKRLKDIACTCGMTFAEKIKTTQVNWVTWSDTRKGS
jgi:hypothetical protein